MDNLEFQTNQYEARIQWLSDEVMRLVKLLAEERASKQDVAKNKILLWIAEMDVDDMTEACAWSTLRDVVDTVKEDAGI